MYINILLSDAAVTHWHHIQLFWIIMNQQRSFKQSIAR